VVSYWDVSDEATAKLMSDLFAISKSKPGLSNGEMMREATRTLLDGKDPIEVKHQFGKPHSSPMPSARRSEIAQRIISQSIQTVGRMPNTALNGHRASSEPTRLLVISMSPISMSTSS
jgi:CHAT domain-containing protein